MKEKTDFKKWIKPAIIVAVIIAVCLIFNAFYEGRFLSLNNLVILTSHAIIPTFVAWGMCFVFACDYTDMSIGAVTVLTANMAGHLGLAIGIPGIIIGGIVTGTLLMTLNFMVLSITVILSHITINGGVPDFFAASRISSTLQ